MPESIAYNCDCMEYLRSLPDKSVDLSCVDPPYGGGGADNEYKGAVVGRFGGRFEKYHLGEVSSQSLNVEREREREREREQQARNKSNADGRNLGGEVQPSRGCL